MRGAWRRGMGVNNKEGMMKTSKIKTVRNIGRIRTLLIVLAVAVCTVAAEDLETLRKKAEAGDAEAQSGLGAEIQTISLEDATHGDDWSHGPRTTIDGIPIISTGKRRATMTFEVTVGAPGGTYQVFLPVVKAFNAAHIGVYFDGELQVEADMFSASNVQHSILITER